MYEHALPKDLYFWKVSCASLSMLANALQSNTFISGPKMLRFEVAIVAPSSLDLLTGVSATASTWRSWILRNSRKTQNLPPHFHQAARFS